MLVIKDTNKDATAERPFIIFEGIDAESGKTFRIVSPENGVPEGLSRLTVEVRNGRDSLGVYRWVHVDPSNSDYARLALMGLWMYFSQGMAAFLKGSNAPDGMPAPHELGARYGSTIFKP